MWRFRRFCVIWKCVVLVINSWYVLCAVKHDYDWNKAQKTKTKILTKKKKIQESLRLIAIFNISLRRFIIIIIFTDLQRPFRVVRRWWMSLLLFNVVYTLNGFTIVIIRRMCRFFFFWDMKNYNLHVVCRYCTGLAF